MNMVVGERRLITNHQREQTTAYRLQSGGRSAAPALCIKPSRGGRERRRAFPEQLGSTGTLHQSPQPTRESRPLLYLTPYSTLQIDLCISIRIKRDPLCLTSCSLTYQPPPPPNLEYSHLCVRRAAEVARHAHDPGLLICFDIPSAAALPAYPGVPNSKSSASSASRHTW